MLSIEGFIRTGIIKEKMVTHFIKGLVVGELSIKKFVIIVMAAVISLTCLGEALSASAEEIPKLSVEQRNKIEEYVEQERKESNIPGIAVGFLVCLMLLAAGAAKIIMLIRYEKRHHGLPKYCTKKI